MEHEGETQNTQLFNRPFDCIALVENFTVEFPQFEALGFG
jgi:hypothetical protein